MVLALHLGLFKMGSWIPIEGSLQSHKGTCKDHPKGLVSFWLLGPNSAPRPPLRRARCRASGHGARYLKGDQRGRRGGTRLRRKIGMMCFSVCLQKQKKWGSFWCQFSTNPKKGCRQTKRHTDATKSLCGTLEVPCLIGQESDGFQPLVNT